MKYPCKGDKAFGLLKMEKCKIKPIFLYNSRKFASFNSVNLPWNGILVHLIFHLMQSILDVCIQLLCTA